MRVRFLGNLGSIHALECNKETGAKLNYKDCKTGAVVDLPDEAFAWFRKRRDFDALIEEAEDVKAVSKKPEITAPAK